MKHIFDWLNDIRNSLVITSNLDIQKCNSCGKPILDQITRINSINSDTITTRISTDEMHYLCPKCSNNTDTTSKEN